MADIGQQWQDAMRRGDQAAAWRLNDTVLAGRDGATRDDPLLPYHQRWVWDGRPFRGRDVLVRCYHGLGDSLQFARFLAPLRHEVASLTLEAQPPLLPVLARLAGPDRLIPFVLDAPAPPSACDIEIMELPHMLRLPPDAVAPPYLHAAADILPAGAIGLCWQAGGWDTMRSVPPALLAPLARLRPAYTLQPAATDLPVRNPAGCPNDVAATASLIAGLELIITVDTMVAHLAGALGRPTWLLLQRDADWRWMQHCASSPWYPSMRLYRQSVAGGWRAVIEQVVADLMAAGSRPAPVHRRCPG